MFRLSPVLCIFIVLSVSTVLFRNSFSSTLYDTSWSTFKQTFSFYYYSVKCIVYEKFNIV